MKKILFLLLGLVATNLAGSINEKLLPIDTDIQIAHRISRCMRDAVEHLFTPSNDVVMIVPDLTHRPEVMEVSLMGRFANRVVKIFTNFPNELIDKPGQSIRETSFVLMDRRVNLRRRLQHPLVNNWEEYIIVTGATTQWLKEFADDLWNLGFLKVAFVSVTSIGESTLLRLIRDTSSRDSSPTLVTYDLCNQEKGRRSSMVVHSFSSFFQTPVNASLSYTRLLESTGDQVDFSRHGLDGELTSLGIDVMEIFADKYNIKLEKYEWKNQSMSNWSDAMYRCAAGQFDFFYARHPPSRRVDRRLIDAVSWYKYESLVLVGSLRSSLRPLSGYFVPYRRTVWICTIVLLVVFGIFAHAIDVLNHRGLIHERITALTIWSIFVGQSLPSYPAKFSLRFVLGMWLLHNQIIGVLYAGRFSSALTASVNTEMLRTFQDVLDSGRPICGDAKVKELLDDRSDSQIHAIYNRLELVPPKYAFHKIFEKGYICARHRTYVNDYNWINSKNESLHLYVLVEAVIVKYPSFFFAKRHHPYGREFDRIISFVRDAGLIFFLNNKYKIIVAKNKDEVTLSAIDGEFLKLKHLTVLFYMLVIGHVISSIIFLIELCMHERLVKLRNRRH